MEFVLPVVVTSRLALALNAGWSPHSFFMTVYMCGKAGAREDKSCADAKQVQNAATATQTTP